MSLKTHETVSSINEYKEPTLRERIAHNLAEAQDRVTQLSKLEHTLPARWLDMTGDQIWEKFGFHVHF